MHLFPFSFWFFIAPANPRKPPDLSESFAFRASRKGWSGADKNAALAVRVRQQKTEASD